MRPLVSAVFISLTAIAPQITATELPQDFGYSDRIEILLDAGHLWQWNTQFHPLSIDSITRRTAGASYTWMLDYIHNPAMLGEIAESSRQNPIKLTILPALQLLTQTGPNRDVDNLAWSPQVWASASFKQHWFARLFVRGTNNERSLTHYTGVSRGIPRAGMSTGEIDQSVFGYDGNWMRFEFGRSREIWGPLTEDNLLASGSSPAYERLLIHFTHKRLSYRFIYGFLESTNDEVIRYIVGRALEYRNRRNLTLGIGEMSILAGENRPLDLAYLNPFALHIEAEQNKRSNRIHGNRNNAIWFINADWLALRSLRLSGSMLMDEFQLDQSARDRGSTDALGFLGRAAWTIIRQPVGITALMSYVRIGTYTMQHSYRYCNFVSRGKLLGHPLGNDADRITMGVRMATPWRMWLEAEYGQRRRGDNSLAADPYRTWDDFIKVPFPSGDVRKNQYLGLKLDAQPTKNFFLGLKGQFDLSHRGDGSALEAWTILIRYQLSPIVISFE